MGNFIIRYRVLHIIFWLLYLANYVWELCIHGEASLPFLNVLTLCVLSMVFYMLCVYVNVYLLLNSLFFKGRYTLFLLASITNLVLFSLVSTGSDHVLQPLLFHRPALSSTPVLFLSHFIDNFLMTVGFSGVIAVHSYVLLEKKNHRLEKEQLESEMAFLKLQMNPHFLFNAINSVFILIDLNKMEARELLDKFSNMLRYQLYECSAERVPIEKEIEFIENYCIIEEKRRGDLLKINLQVDEGIEDFSVAPFILFPFIENAFKHAVENESTRQIPILIRLGYSQHKLILKVENYAAFVPSGKEGGIGLSNVQRRLNLLYENKYSLTMTNHNKKFTVELILQVA